MVGASGSWDFRTFGGAGSGIWDLGSGAWDLGSGIWDWELGSGIWDSSDRVKVGALATT